MVTFKRDQTLLRAGTLFACSLLLGAALSVARDNTYTSLASGMQGPPDDPEPDPLLTSDRCIACHKGVATSTGTDVSIGYDWRASMMANSARDPYWQAAVRREIVDHPQASQEIQALCSRCHMPMASEVARSEGRVSSVFDHLPVANITDETESALSADGVSCAICHRMESDALGTDASFSGGFRIDPRIDGDSRPVFGPFEPDPGGAGIMHSATGFRPEEAKHIQSSELCASCHTVLTHAIGLDSGEGPEFPEQVPYLEWRASSFAARNTCQDCHMPLVEEDVPVTRVLGRARAEVSRHVFRGGNFFMLRMLNRYRDELGVVALPAELAMAAARTEEHLRGATATATVTSAEVGGDRLVAQVDVRNLAGHKFPTAYPSRRAWLQLVVSDGQGDAVFESGPSPLTAAWLVTIMTPTAPFTNRTTARSMPPNRYRSTKRSWQTRTDPSQPAFRLPRAGSRTTASCQRASMPSRPVPEPRSTGQPAATATSVRAGTGCGTSFLSTPPPDRSRSLRRYGSSQLRTVGRRTLPTTTPSKPNVSSGTTGRWPVRRR